MKKFGNIFTSHITSSDYSLLQITTKFLQILTAFLTLQITTTWLQSTTAISKYKLRQLLQITTEQPVNPNLFPSASEASFMY